MRGHDLDETPDGILMCVRCGESPLRPEAEGRPCPADADLVRPLVEVLEDALHAGAIECQITEDEYAGALAWLKAKQPTWPVSSSGSSVTAGE